MDSTGEQLHPNWRALATVHLPLKRFLRSGTTECERGRVDVNSHKYRIDGVSGDEVQQFYEEILESPASVASPPVTNKAEQHRKERPRRTQSFPYEKNKFFRLATANDVQQLCQMRVTNEQVNERDAYGWTALMMAACEGAHDTVAWLLRHGAEKEATDKRGLTALALAKRKGHHRVVSILEAAARAEEAHTKLTTTPLQPFYCEICQRSYTESTWHEHQTSTVHQFNLKSNLPPNRLQKFNISVANRGLHLMVKQGWDQEHGLGPTQAGRLYPIKTVLRKQRSGLGVEQSPPRVTHFAAFDKNATRRRNQPEERRRTRNDMRLEKVREWKRNRRLRNELS